MKHTSRALLLTLLTAFSCDTPPDFRNLHWGMSTKKVDSLMRKSGLEGHVSENEIQYEIRNESDIFFLTCLFVRGKLSSITILPKRSAIHSEKDLYRVAAKLETMMNDEFGQPADVWDSRKDTPNPLRYQSRYAVYFRGATGATVKLIDARNTFLLEAFIADTSDALRDIISIYGPEFVAERPGLNRGNH